MNEIDKFFDVKEMVFYASRKFVDYRDDKKFTILTDLNGIILNLHNSIDKLQGQRKINAENTLKTLIDVYEHLGLFYVSELNQRIKLKNTQKSLLDASAEIDRLKSEVELLKKMEEF